jgi:hypothetical protein
MTSAGVGPAGDKGAIMGAGFTVDSNELAVAGQAAQTLADTLRAQTQDAFAGTAAFGHDRLQQAVSAFHARAQHGLTRFAAAGDSVANRLTGTAAAYQQTEQTSTDRFNAIGADNA